MSKANVRTGDCNNCEVWLGYWDKRKGDESMMFQVFYDFTFLSETTSGCTIRFATREEAVKWIADGKDDPYIYNMELIEEVA